VGAMGRGIAQIAAQAGSTVLLFDTQADAIAKARDAPSAPNGTSWSTRAAWTPPMPPRTRQRLRPAARLAELAGCDLVVEAVVEKLDVKQGLFAELEGVVGPDAVLATNTSSLSVTAIAAGLKRPQRFAGLPLLQPVPLMKVVEVIAGLKTAPQCASPVRTTRARWATRRCRRKTRPASSSTTRGAATAPRRCASSAKAWPTFATIDRILRDQVGFKLGPFELMDLTALDVSHPVMESIYRQYYDEPRYRPSVITAQRLAGGVLGKQGGRRAFTATNGAPRWRRAGCARVETCRPCGSPPARRAAPSCTSCSRTWARRSKPASRPRPRPSRWWRPLGFDVTTVAVVERLDPARTIGIDMLIDDAATRRRVLATNPATRSDMRDAAHALFARDGKAVSVIRDSGRLCHPARGGHHRQHRQRHLPAAHLQPAGPGNRRHAGPGLPAGPAGHGRPLGPGQHPGSAVQHADGVRRPALPPQPLAAPARGPAIGLSLPNARFERKKTELLSQPMPRHCP
jgi:3-hydroxybutyryl-CoA dehydrogenase